MLGVLCTGVAYIVYFRLIEAAGPARALTVTNLVPVCAACYGSAFLGERIASRTLACEAVIVCGVALSTSVLGFSRNQKTQARGDRPAG